VNTVFVLLFLTTFILFVIGLIRPSRFAKIFKSVKNPRKARHIIGFVAVLSFLAIGLTAPEQDKQLSNINTKTVATKQNAQEKPKPIEKKPQIKKEVVTETESIPFDSKTVNDGSLNKGTSKITTSGSNGTKTTTYEITYIDGKQTNKKLVKNEVTAKPVAQVTAIGTKAPAPKPAPKPAPAPKQQATSNCDPNYSPCVPNVSYDLDCPDIGFSVRVTGYDKHRFDRDGDGYGCESY
jgi:hypothetical protein